MQLLMNHSVHVLRALMSCKSRICHSCFWSSVFLKLKNNKLALHNSFCRNFPPWFPEKTNQELRTSLAADIGAKSLCALCALTL